MRSVECDKQSLCEYVKLFSEQQCVVLMIYEIHFVLSYLYMHTTYVYHFEVRDGHVTKTAALV
jgi:hypothetical protein